MEKSLSQSIKSETRQGHFLSHVLFNIAPEALAGAVGQKKDIKGYKWEKKICRQYDVSHKNSPQTTRKLPETIKKKIRKVLQCKIHLENPVIFLHINSKCGHAAIYNRIKDNKLSRNKPNQRCEIFL